MPSEEHQLKVKISNKMNRIDLCEVKVLTIDAELLCRFQPWSSTSVEELRLVAGRGTNRVILATVIAAYVAAARRVFLVERGENRSLVLEDEEGFLFNINDALDGGTFALTYTRFYKRSPYPSTVQPRWAHGWTRPAAYAHRSGIAFVIIDDGTHVYVERVPPPLDWERAANARMETLWRCARCAVGQR